MIAKLFYTDKEIIEIITADNIISVSMVLKYIYKNNYFSIKKLVLKNNGSEEEAEDIFQDSIVILYEHIKERKFREQSSIKTYLYAIARNLWMNKLKTKHSSIKNLVDIKDGIDDEDNVIEQIIDWERRELLQQSIAKLDNDCKQLLLDFYFNSMRMKEIKDKFNFASEHVARNQKYRCMKYLRRLIKKENVEKELLQT